MTRLILGLADSVDKNLIPALDDGTKAWDENTAAGKEAEKRFATSEFLFKRLSNSVNLAAATIGTELLPVLNDLATEGIAFLTKPATQKGIKEFATALGKGVRGLAGIITSINWGAVAGFLSHRGRVRGPARHLVHQDARLGASVSHRRVRGDEAAGDRRASSASWARGSSRACSG